MKSFFAESQVLNQVVLRPLSHIRAYWELTWDAEKQEYLVEDDSFASLLNQLIEDLGQCSPPSRYHDNEDRLAEFVRDGHLNWPIRKVGNRWVGADYESILEQGGFDDID
ncbi:MAG: hypothetical protein IIA03_07730, partial [Proteobacteria bacterium]|nr:hypothetical protein [Pseudomonadota bacterium]